MQVLRMQVSADFVINTGPGYLSIYSFYLFFLSMKLDSMLLLTGLKTLKVWQFRVNMVQFFDRLK